MSAKLIHVTPIDLVISSIRKCYLSESDSFLSKDNEWVLGKKDQAIIEQIINSGHTSTIEHSLLTFDLVCTRGCLQELVRHRIGTSFSVQSTRYTLKKILNQVKEFEDCRKFLFQTECESLNNLNMQQLWILKNIINEENIPNDISKYGIPEALLIELNMSLNFRSFRHLLELRKSQKAHFEIRDLVTDMENQIPEKYSIFWKNL